VSGQFLNLFWQRTEENARYATIRHILGEELHTPALYEQAFTHRSVQGEKNDDPLLSNERMEFLGDAILGLSLIHI